MTPADVVGVESGVDEASMIALGVPNSEEDMPAYLIGRLEVLDQVKVDAYAAVATPILESYGGRVLAAEPSVRHLEGPEPTGTLVIIEFPSRQQAEAFWDDPDYQAAAKLREGALELQLDLIQDIA